MVGQPRHSERNYLCVGSSYTALALACFSMFVERYYRHTGSGTWSLLFWRQVLSPTPCTESYVRDCVSPVCVRVS